MANSQAEIAGAANLKDEPTPPVRSAESIRRRFGKWLWGYDYFISYHWASGGAYAVALSQRLRDRNYDVFLDRAEYAMGDDWKGVGERALRNTQRLVLVATREAVTDSRPVEHEIKLFTSRGKQVVPIVFSGDRASDGRHSIEGLDRSQHPTLALISESQLYVEESHENLPRGPSDGVIQQLMDTHRVMRRRDRRALAIGLAAAVLMAFSLFSMGSWVRAYLAQRAAEGSLRGEKDARIAEQKQRERAEERARIATSRQFAALSAAERKRQLPRSLLLAVEAVRVSNTYEARDNLVKALQERPEVTSFLHVEEGRVGEVAFRPDGKVIAVGYDIDGGGGVLLFDAASGARMPGPPMAVPEGNVGGVAFRPDGKAIAVGYAVYGGSGSRGGVVMFDATTHARMAVTPMAIKQGSVNGVAFSPDGRAVAAGYGDFTSGRGGVALFDATSGARMPGPTMAVKTGEGPVLEVAFSPDGRRIAAAHQIGGPGYIGLVGGGVILFDAASRDRMPGPPMPVEEGNVKGMAFRPDGKAIAVGYGAANSPDGGGVVLFDADTHARMAGPTMQVQKSRVRGLAFRPDGKAIAVGLDADRVGGVALFDADSGAAMAGSPMAIDEGSASAVAFSPDGRTLAAGYAAETGVGGVLLIDPTSRTRMAGPTMELDGRSASAVAFSPDGRAIAAGYGGGVGIDRGGVALFDAASGARMPGPTMQVSEGSVDDVAFSPDGKAFAAGYGVAGMGGVIWFDAASRDRMPGSPVEIKEGRVEGVAFSPDGKTLAAGYGSITGNGVILFDAATRARMPGPPMEVKEGQVCSVAFRPDGRAIAAGYRDAGNSRGGVVLFDVASRARMPGPPIAVAEGTVSSVAFRPDGRAIAAGYGVVVGSGRGGVLLFDAASGARMPGPPMAVDEGYVHGVAFRPDGRAIAAGYGFVFNVGGVVLFDAASRARVVGSPLTTDEGNVSSVAFSPDGKTIAAGYGKGGKVVPFDVDLDSWQRIAGRVANRNLTGDEWRVAFPDDPYRPTFPDLPPPRGVLGQ